MSEDASMKSASLIKWTKGGLKNPMARARGLGAAHGALHHWIMQRLTAILALPLTLWLCFNMVHLAHADHATVIAWLARPMNAILMIMTIITFFYHAVLGCQVVIEDYMHGEARKFVQLIALKLVAFGMAVACIFAVLKIAL